METYIEPWATESERQEKWDRRFLEVARMVSTWSKDPSTKVGAVVVAAPAPTGTFDMPLSTPGAIVGTGYNGFPRGVADTEERLGDRPTKYAMVVHAELNAVLQAGHRARGGTIYVYPAFGAPPLCTGCAKAVIQSGIRRVVGYAPDEQNDHGAIERWAPEIATAYTMSLEAGLAITMLDEER